MNLYISPTSDDASQSAKMVDALTDVDTLRRSAPGYYEPRFEAIAQLRALDDGTLHRGNEFRRVASLVNVPMMQALRIVDPRFLLDKKRFYKWLDRNPAYCTYQRRNSAARLSQVERDLGGLGKEILMDGVRFEGGATGTPAANYAADEGPTLTNEPDNGGAQNVVMTGGSSGNREGSMLPRVPTGSGGNANPVEDRDAQVSVGPSTTPAEIFRGTRS